MSTDQSQPSAVVYQLKIVLRDYSPLIWRRLLVPSDTTIAELHTIVQTAMGWEDLHLHRFRVHGKEYGIYRDGGIWFDDDPGKVTLADFKLRPGERFVYEYDMGDFWQHDLRLEHVLPRDPHTIYSVCIAGAGDCPPEDCGGPPGYERLLAERSSWALMEQVHEDLLLVAHRLLDFCEGGPQPTYEWICPHHMGSSAGCVLSKLRRVEHTLAQQVKFRPMLYWRCCTCVRRSLERFRYLLCPFPFYRQHL